MMHIVNMGALLLRIHKEVISIGRSVVLEKTHGRQHLFSLVRRSWWSSLMVENYLPN